MSQDKIILFCDNTLDSSGCLINLEYFLPDNEKTIIRTNNRQIDKDVNKILELYKENESYILFICNIDTNNLKLLDNIFKNYKTVIMGNHNKKHNEIVINNNKSCTYNIYELFQSKFNEIPKDLKIFNNLVNIYKTSDYDSTYYEASMGLNNYYWENNKENDLENYMIQNKFSLPTNILSKFEIYKKESEKLYQELIKNNMLLRNEDIVICLTDKYIDYIMNKEFKIGTNIIIFGNSYGAIRVYYNKNFNLTTNKKKRIFNTSVSGKKIFFGNENSFNIYIDNLSFNNIINELKRISNIIISILKDNND